MIFYLMAHGIADVIYILAALIPAIVLLVYIYRKDTVEKEPISLILTLLVFGAISTIPAGIAETILSKIFGFINNINANFYAIFSAFIIVAVIEEGVKYGVVKIFAWKNKNFNYRFDGIVYSVVASLGFAALENILYVFNYGLGVAVQRALLSIPGHTVFGIIMGYYIGRAKAAQNYGRTDLSRTLRKKAFIYAALAHGFYDACLMVDMWYASIIFYIYVLVLYINMFKLVKKESLTDYEI